MNVIKRNLLIFNVGWSFLHLTLAVMFSGSWGGDTERRFIYPFFSEVPSSYVEEVGKIDFYDWSEFVLYSGIGWLVFFIYWVNTYKSDN
jgi:hypothetical protein